MGGRAKSASGTLKTAVSRFEPIVFVAVNALFFSMQFSESSMISS